MTEKQPCHLRIGLLSYRSNPFCGGQGVYVQNLSRALTRLGHHVEIISGPPELHVNRHIPLIRMPSLDLYNPEDPFRTPSLKELMNPLNFMEWAGVVTMGFPEPFVFGIRAFQYLRNRFHQYDVIHDNQSLSYGVWLMQRHIPVVATIHHPITVDRSIDVRAAENFWKKLKMMRWYSFIGMQKRVSRSLHHIITVSQSAMRDIQKEFHMNADRFHVAPNGIDTDRFFPMPQIHREPGRIIVTNSADTPLKGLSYLLPAIKDISRKQNVRLIVIGSPKKNGVVETLIRDLDLTNRVTFTDRIDHSEFVQEYARASVAVVPSLYEGFGLPAGEAMACATPVVSTTGGALPEVVGNAGVLVPPGDSGALSQAISNLLNHPAQAAELGQAGYRRVHRLFTWKAAAQKTVDVYRSAIDAYR
ncbi:MAG TPA: glycosyltransferase family 4 protein [Desulfatirhabdiaceae bacterium]|nr:glycosyltransferase family 4 protein [Desulfatirhabdiaceae bacterium]